MNYRNYYIRKCTIEDVDSIINLQNQIIEELEDKTILRKNTQEMFISCVQEPHLTLGIFNKEKELIAVAIFYDAQGNNEDLSKQLENHEVKISANFKVVLVRNDYRGNKFQKALVWIIEKYAANRGYTHLCTTVSPNNSYSLNNFYDMKYIYDCTKLKYGENERNLLVKNIEESVRKHNKNIMRIASLMEDIFNDKNFLLEQIDLKKCFKGDIEIANTGDILVYEDKNSKEKYYSLFINKLNPLIVIFNHKKNKFEIKEFEKYINNLEYTYALIRITESE